MIGLFPIARFASILQICKIVYLFIMSIDPARRAQLEALRDAVKSRSVSLRVIGSATGVHISQVSRILAGKATRVSPNVEKICKFAATAGFAQSYSGGEELLWKAVADVWDGTAAHAQALAQLLRAIDSYRAFSR